MPPPHLYRSGAAGIDYDAITIRNLGESPLLRLPRELRDMIWDFATDSYHVIIAQDQSGKMRFSTSKMYTGTRFDSRLDAATIFKQGVSSSICRTIQSETTDLQYSRITFSVDPRSTTSCTIEITRQLEHMLQRKNIKSIALSSSQLRFVDYWREIFPELKRVFHYPPEIYAYCPWDKFGTNTWRQWGPGLEVVGCPPYATRETIEVSRIDHL